MELRNYIILKSPGLSVNRIYFGPRETVNNVEDIASAVGKKIRELVSQHYDQGYDVIVVRAQNLQSVRNSLPELKWGGAQTYPLISASAFLGTRLG